MASLAPRIREDSVQGPSRQLLSEDPSLMNYASTAKKTTTNPVLLAQFRFQKRSFSVISFIHTHVHTHMHTHTDSLFLPDRQCS